MPEEKEKATQAQAHYTPSGTEEEHCSVCTMFVYPDRCTAVQGTISRNGCCRFFKHRYAK